MQKFGWYINRLKTMNVAELLYRSRQIINNSFEKLYHQTPSYQQVVIADIKLQPDTFIQEFNFDDKSYHFFNSEIELDKPINFHKDVSSGKEFPLTYAKGINMRTDQYGNAKLVWEINRLEYLLPIILKYHNTRNSALLNKFMVIMESWQQQNPYLKGINWYSNIEVNLRLINWYWCWIILNDIPELKSDENFNRFKNNTWLPLIYQHCIYSYKNPSYYSSANNHLVSEYAGLYVAATLWVFPESDKWKKYAQKGLEKEIVLQHSNGINKEEAAEYIQFITDLFLLPYIAALHTGADFSSAYKKTLLDIARYINNFLDVKGNFPKYGDEDDGKVLVPDGDTYANNFISILNTISVLFNKPELKRSNNWDVKSSLLTGHVNGYNTWHNFNNTQPPANSSFYKPEGHFIFKKNTGAEIYLHFDAAPLGYLSIAAHGHADALSIILHIDGHPFLVDPGTYTYHTEPLWRKYFVGTAAHNTIVIDDLNQAEHAGPTLWLQHYNINITECLQNPHTEKVTAIHNGYQKIKAAHTRSVEFDRDKNKFTIKDIIVKQQDSCVKQFWHLHPSIKITGNGNNFILENDLHQKIELVTDMQLKYTIVEGASNTVLGWYSESFLKKQTTKVLIGELINTQVENEIITYINILDK